MRQLFQDVRGGAVRLLEVPSPAARPGQVVVRTRRTLISPGTERSLREFASAGLVAKALKYPDRAHQVLDRLRTGGLAATVEAVRARLDEPQPLGYCNVGEVLEVGPGVAAFRPGDRVVSNGPHAERIRVGRNLCATVPATVDDDSAAFAVLSAVALQGIRLAAPSLGERVVVLGLGLVGLLTVQILRAAGCRVLGADFVSERLKLAREWGAHPLDLASEADPVAAAMDLTGGRGVDAVLVTAATASPEPVSQAARMCRQRGRIVLVGVAGLELNREEFYQKELSFQVSCSYGPGRYDPVYEEQGVDYPYGHVRWTEKRNFEAVLELMESNRLDVRPLISREFPFEEAAEAYGHLEQSPAALGILLRYEETGPPPAAATETPSRRSEHHSEGSPGVAPSLGLIGAGQFARRVLLPALRGQPARLRALSGGGGEAARAAAKFGVERCVSRPEDVLADPEVNAVIVTTRHGSHPALVAEALGRGQHVFVEKPVAIDEAGLHAVEEAYHNQSSPPVLMVGFNRRFSPHVRKMRDLLKERTHPISMTMTVNAGRVPSGHWIHDPAEGGGRILGEACHFIDLLRHLAGARILSISGAQARPAEGPFTGDDAVLTLAFADGSIGSIQYFSGGHRAVPKERLEVYGGGRTLALDDFRRLRGHGFRGFRALKTWRGDKGHRQEMAAFLAAVRAGGPSPIPFDEIVDVTRATFAAQQALVTAETVSL